MKKIIVNFAESIKEDIKFGSTSIEKAGKMFGYFPKIDLKDRIIKTFY